MRTVPLIFCIGLPDLADIKGTGAFEESDLRILDLTCDCPKE